MGNPVPGLHWDLALLEANRLDCSWIAEYGFVSSLCNTLPARRIAEIGVAYGYHAEQILKACPDIQYVGIDPYVAGYDPSDLLAGDVQCLFGDTPENSMNRLYLCVVAKLAAKWKGRATICRIKSQDAAEKFKDRCFDLVYVDGDHTFEGVSKDLSVWGSKIRGGGFFCGDDYDWEGVRRAVDQFAGLHGLLLEPCPANKWLIRIPS